MNASDILHPKTVEEFNKLKQGDLLYLPPGSARFSPTTAKVLCCVYPPKNHRPHVANSVYVRIDFVDPATNEKVGSVTQEIFWHNYNNPVGSDQSE